MLSSMFLSFSARQLNLMAIIYKEKEIADMLTDNINNYHYFIFHE